MKCCIFLDQLLEYELLKKDYAPFNLIIVYKNSKIVYLHARTSLHYLQSITETLYLGRFNVELLAGLPGFDLQQEKEIFLYNVQTCSGAHLASYLKDAFS
jgi:hypothetical protein